ncbi:MAG: PilZ domain-containing protein [Acidobacteriota bacterium]
MSDDRRNNPRVRILGRLHGRAIALEVPVTVTEISLGGMGIQTDAPFPTGAVHEFELTLGDESVVTLRGKVVHCQKVPGEAGGFLSGVQFTDEAVDE